MWKTLRHGLTEKFNLNSCLAPVTILNKFKLKGQGWLPKVDVEHVVRHCMANHWLLVVQRRLNTAGLIQHSNQEQDDAALDQELGREGVNSLVAQLSEKFMTQCNVRD